ncbi:MAG: protein phosphatase 2C domain-containing protein [Desulfotignum sp.]|nr:protein phosphatase 2C domain-containing protein [Desulfotignum sp.]
MKINPDPEWPDFALLALADGLGGAIGGEIAADHVIKHLQGLNLQEDTSPLDSLKRFYMKMDRDIFSMGETDSYLSGMGTTLTCAVVSDNTVFWAHSGDSRLYFLHGDHLTLITGTRPWRLFSLPRKRSPGSGQDPLLPAGPGAVSWMRRAGTAIRRVRTDRR